MEPGSLNTVKVQGSNAPHKYFFFKDYVCCLQAI